MAVAEPGRRMGTTRAGRGMQNIGWASDAPAAKTISNFGDMHEIGSDLATLLEYLVAENSLLRSIGAVDGNASPKPPSTAATAHRRQGSYRRTTRNPLTQPPQTTDPAGSLRSSTPTSPVHALDKASYRRSVETAGRRSCPARLRGRRALRRCRG